MKKISFLVLLFLSFIRLAKAQDDLMNMLDAQSPDPVHYTAATFKGSRLINGHTVETRKRGALEFIIGHRFGRYQLRGLRILRPQRGQHSPGPGIRRCRLSERWSRKELFRENLRWLSETEALAPKQWCPLVSGIRRGLL